MQETSETIRAEYQRQRLWCGIVGIGVVLVPLWALLAMGYPAVWAGLVDGLGEGLGWNRSAEAGGGLPGYIAGGLTGLALALFVGLVQLPVDLAARKIERKYGQLDATKPFNWAATYAARVAEWTVGVATAGVFMGLVYDISGGNSDSKWIVACWAALSVLGLVHVAYPLMPGRMVELTDERRAWLEEASKELERKQLKLPEVVIFEHGEKSLAGGWNGWFGMRKLMVAETIFDVSPKVGAMLIAREMGHLKKWHRFQSTFESVIWIFLGFTFSWTLLPESYLNKPAAAVMSVAAVMSTLCWVGLFIWPVLGRWQVLQADAFVLEVGFTADEAMEMLNELAERNKPDEDLPAAKAYVFHPMPTMKVRREAIRQLSGVSEARAEVKGAV